MITCAILTLAALSLQGPGEGILLEIHRDQYRSVSRPDPKVTVTSQRTDGQGNSVGTYRVTAPSQDEAVALARQAQIDALSAKITAGQTAVQQDISDLSRVISSVKDGVFDSTNRNSQRLTDIELAMGREIEGLKTEIKEIKKQQDRVQVVVEVSINPKHLQRGLERGLLSNYRTIVVVTDQRGVVTPELSPVSTALEEGLIEKDTRVLDYEYCAADPKLSGLLPSLFGNPKGIGRQMGEVAFANFVVFATDAVSRFSENNSGIVSFRASCRLQVVMASTGQLILSKTVGVGDRDRVVGFGNSDWKAKESAMSNLGERCAAVLFQNLETRLKETPTILRFMAKDDVEAEAFRSAITSDKKVLGVQSRKNSQGVLLSVTATENAGPMLAGLADRIIDAGFRIRGVGAK